MSSIDVIINVYNETSMKKVRGMACEKKTTKKIVCLHSCDLVGKIIGGKTISGEIKWCQKG